MMEPSILPPWASERTGPRFPWKFFLQFNLAIFVIGVAFGMISLYFPRVLEILLAVPKVYADLGATAMIGTKGHQALFLVASGIFFVVIFLVPTFIAYLMIYRTIALLETMIPQDVMTQIRDALESARQVLKNLSVMDREVREIVEKHRRFSFEFREAQSQMREVRTLIDETLAQWLSLTKPPPSSEGDEGKDGEAAGSPGKHQGEHPKIEPVGGP